MVLTSETAAPFGSPRRGSGEVNPPVHREKQLFRYTVLAIGDSVANGSDDPTAHAKCASAVLTERGRPIEHTSWRPARSVCAPLPRSACMMPAATPTRTPDVTRRLWLKG